MKKRAYVFHDELAKAPRRAVPPMDPAPGGAIDTPAPAGPLADSGTPIFPGVWRNDFYDAVNHSPNRKFRPQFATDSKVTLTQWSRLRALSLARWAYINVPVVKGAVDLNARLTVGTGFSPKTHMADEKLAQAADAYVAEQFKDIGFMNGESMDELLLHDSRSVDVDGDLGYVLTQDEFGQPKIQLIEGHRITSGLEVGCRDGVFVDAFGRRVAFNVAIPDDDNSFAANFYSKTRRIAAQDFVYLAERNRPDELRSMTNLIHALNPLQDLYEIIAFATASAKRNAEIGMVIETPDPENPPIGPTRQTIKRIKQDATSGQPAQPQQSVTYEQIYGGGGKIPVLKQGEKLESFAHNQPAPTIKEWSEFIIRGISVGFGLPFEILWNPEAIGGANTRLITAMVRQRIAQRRACLVFPKLTRIRFWILSRAVKRGILPPADYTAVDWRPNFQDITVDAGRESKERRENVLHGLDTFSGYYSENGENYADQINVRRSDLELQCAAATELQTKFPKLTFADALNRISMLGTATVRQDEQPAPAKADGKPDGGPMNINVDARPGAGKRSFKIQRPDGNVLTGEIIEEPQPE